MSGEGGCCSNADYAAWGYAPGNYLITCVDCPPGQPDEDKILGSISSMRCLYHAIKARSHYGSHTEGCMSFYEPEPLTLDSLDALVERAVTAFKVCFWGGAITFLAAGAAYAVG